MSATEHAPQSRGEGRAVEARAPRAAISPLIGAADMTGLLLHLQRTAGNAAVNRWLREVAAQEGERTTTTPVIQRMAPSAPNERVDPLGSPSASPAVVIQRVWVKKQEKQGKIKSVTWVKAKQGDEGAVNTETMKLSDKRAVLRALQDDSKRNADLIQDLTKEINSITGEVEEKDLIAIESELDKLLAKQANGLDDKDKIQIKQLAFKALSGLEFLGTFDEGDSAAITYRTILLSHLEKLAKLDGEALKQARAIAEKPDLNVTPAEIDAYRADIRNRGVWGGGAEASVVATALNRSVHIFILDSEGNYVKVDTVGAPAGAASQFSLLNLGNHYVAIANTHQNGTAYKPEHIVYNPRGDGDCMFNALFHALTDGTLQANYTNPQNQQVTPLTPLNFVAVAREIAATGLSNQMITLSIEEVLLSGQGAGVGPELKKLVGFRRYDKAGLHHLINSSGLKPDDVLLKLHANVPETKKLSLDQILTAYEKNRKLESRDAKQAKGSAICADILNVILQEAFAKSIEQETPVDEEQSRSLELTLRKSESEKYRLLHAVVNSPNNGKQLIVTTKDGEEWVLDRIGQLAPRYAFRSISEVNVAELKQNGGIYPSNQSPLQKDKEFKKKFAAEGSTTGSGMGSNKVKATPEMRHVEGEKPSSYLSVTGEKGGTVNAQGSAFGSSLYRIDLSYVHPATIAVLYSGKGMSYYMLANYGKEGKGDKDKDAKSDKAAVIGKAVDFQERHAKTKAQHEQKPSTKVFEATDAGKEDTRLSEKEWQALMDVVRTKEILINAMIPAAALSN